MLSCSLMASLSKSLVAKMGQTALCVFTFESYIPIGLNFLIFFLTGQWHQKNRCGPGLLDGLNWCRYYCKRSLKHLQACRNPNCFFSSNLSNWSPPPAKEGCFVRPIWAGALLACRATAVHSPAFRSNFQYNPNHRFKTAPILFYQSFSSCPSQPRQNTWLHFFQPSPTQPRSLHSHLDTV